MTFQFCTRAVRKHTSTLILVRRDERPSDLMPVAIEQLNDQRGLKGDRQVGQRQRIGLADGLVVDLNRNRNPLGIARNVGVGHFRKLYLVELVQDATADRIDQAIHHFDLGLERVLIVHRRVQLLIAVQTDICDWLDAGGESSG